MKKHKHFLTFFGGMLAAVILCTCVTTALAVSGTVTFNAVNVALNGMIFAEKDKSYQLDSGANIPSSILYKDEEGGSTTYVPIRKFADTFQMPIEWDGSSDKVTVRVDGVLDLYTRGLYSAGWTIDNCIKEVEPIVPQRGKEVLAQVDHRSMEDFTADIPLASGDGRYVSVTVTNHNNKPVEFALGKYEPTIVTSTHIPAGETVTRTFEFISQTEMKNFQFHIFIGNPDYVSLPVIITVSAVQFEG